MNRIGIVSLLVFLAVTPTPPSRSRAHGLVFAGTILAVDAAGKSLVVRNAAGKETRFVWTSATRVIGGDLKAGERVTLRYLDKDGKHIAMSVSIAAATAARTPSAQTPTASATPFGKG
jgi:hypothetical protein